MRFRLNHLRPFSDVHLCLPVGLLTIVYFQTVKESFTLTVSFSTGSISLISSSPQRFLTSSFTINYPSSWVILRPLTVWYNNPFISHLVILSFFATCYFETSGDRRQLHPFTFHQILLERAPICLKHNIPFRVYAYLGAYRVGGDAKEKHKLRLLAHVLAD